MWTKPSGGGEKAGRTILVYQAGTDRLCGSNGLESSRETSPAVRTARFPTPRSGELRDDKDRVIFDAGELTRQSITLPGQEFQAPPSVKDIETINCFTKLKDGRISAVQRTATWLVGTEGRAAIRAQAADGRAVDVRTYRVEYTRLGDA